MYDWVKLNVLLLLMLHLLSVSQLTHGSSFNDGLETKKCSRNCKCITEKKSGKVQVANCVVDEVSSGEPLQCNVEWPVLGVVVKASYFDSVMLVKCRRIKRMMIQSESEITGLNYAMFQHSGMLEILIVNAQRLHGIGNSFLKHLSSLRELEITESVIARVNGNMFQECPVKHRLRISTRLHSIGPATFKACTALRHLDLNYNLLTKINLHTFEGLLSLESLYLAGNRIQTVASFAFSSLPLLTQLDLSDNQLTAISRDTFSQTGSLQTLLMRNNDISHLAIDALKSLRTLTYLDLRNNNLRTLDMSSFSGLGQLRTLYLPQLQCVTEAKLTSITVSTFVLMEFSMFPLCNGKLRTPKNSLSNQNNKLVQLVKTTSGTKDMTSQSPRSNVVWGMFENYPYLLPMLLGGLFVMIMAVVVISVVCHLKNKQINRLRFQEVQPYPMLQSTL